MTGQPMAGVGEDARAEAFRRLAADHLDESYRLARAIVGNPVEAEDAVQDAFVKAWRKWDSLRDPSRFDAWFGRILVNTCRSRLRRRPRQPERDLSVELVRTGIDEFRQADDREMLATALARLSPDHRVVIALHFWRDLTAPQIAERLGIREGTVYSRLHYGLQQLRRTLDDLGAPGATHA